MSTPPPPLSLEAALAAELKGEITNLTERYEATGPAAGHAAATLRADILVPLVLGVALETHAALEGLVTDPPANLRTRARLAEQLRYRATLLRTYLADAGRALNTATPPADIAEAIEAACVEVIRLEDHASTFAGLTYDPGDEAAEAAAFLAATVRGEAVGARRVLAILLGLPTGEAADGGAAEAYVAGYRASIAATLEAEYPEPGSEIPDMPGYVVAECGHRVAASEWRAGCRTCERCPNEDGRPRAEGRVADYLTEHAEARTSLVVLREALAGHTPGEDWSNAPLFLASPADLNATAMPGEREQIRKHTAAVVPVAYLGPPPPAARVPAAALDALADLVATDQVPNAAALGEWLEAHAWDHEHRRWVELPPSTLRDHLTNHKADGP